MKFSRPALLAAVIAIGTACGGSAPDDALGTDVGQAVAVKGSQAGSVLVFLDGSADVHGAERFAAKNDRGRYVYTTLRDHAATSQANLLRELSVERSLNVRSFHLVNAILVENATPELLRKLAARPDVRRIVADTPSMLQTATPSEDDLEGSTEAAAADNIAATTADRVWSELGVTGEGIVVAGQDSGYAWEHPALKRAYRGWNGTSADHRYSWHDAIHGTGSNPCGFDAAAPCDDHGHGTHTMGSIVGDDGGANKIGMAPGARWIGCRNMNRGAGKPSTYLECLEWFLAPYPQGGNPQTDGKPEMAPHVINNSWGCDGTEGCRGQEFIQALANLDAAGILMVVSAGNSGSACGTINAQPATVSDTTLSVGAYSHTNGKIASFSSRGPSALDGKVGPDVTAPGVNIRSSLKSGGYGPMSGTSMAGPHVAGEVALLWSAVPALRGNTAETTRIISASAKATTTTQTCGGVAGTAIPNNTFGWGLIDAYAAIRLAQEPAPTSSR
jgi:serine protease AprX